jgi:predicted transport protein
MGNEMSPDWITAFASLFAVLAASYFASRQISIYKRQADILDKQAYWQESQRNIAKLQTEITRNQNCIIKEQTEIARRQLIIIEYQEQERRKEKNKADLKAELRETQRPYGLRLNIKNIGKANAKNIEIQIDGMPPWSHQLFTPFGVRKTNFPHELGPNQSWEHDVYTCSGMDNKFRMKMQYLDDTGETRVFEQLLGIVRK